MTGHVEATSPGVTAIALEAPPRALFFAVGLSAAGSGLPSRSLRRRGRHVIIAGPSAVLAAAGLDPFIAVSRRRPSQRSALSC
jgi:hypothetical protein